jgi:hypothetical protein
MYVYGIVGWIVLGGRTCIRARSEAKEFTDVTKESGLPVNRRLRCQRPEGKDSTCDLGNYRVKEETR